MKAGWLPALLLAVSLGLPWGTRHTTTFDPGFQIVIPILNGWSGTYTGLQTVPTTSGGGLRTTTHNVIGARHPARFGVVAALALLALGGRARRWAAVVVGVPLLLSGGLGFTASGVAAAWLATLLLAGQALPGRRTEDRA